MKHEKEGQLISNYADALLKVHERSGEFIHCAKRFKSSDKGMEINCSLESSGCTVAIFQQANEVDGRSILSGQVIS